ncbi:zf-HC2 domain-containing protein [Candidatus Latescibacterota bacterium]
MECTNIKDRLTAYVLGDLDPQEKQLIDEHLTACDECRKEAAGIERVMTQMSDLPEEEPGAGMRLRFYSMLDDYRQEMNSSPVRVPLTERLSGMVESWWPSKPVFQFAIAAVFLIAGLWAGRMSVGGGNGNGELAEMRSEMSEMRQMVTIALMNRPSASERLRGVAMSRDVTDPDQQVLTELIRTLNTDSNVSVRLAAVDVARNYVDRDWVRVELVRSLGQQDSPLVQVLLIELLASIREQRASDAFKTLIENQDSIEPVKKRAQKALDTFI